MFVFGKMSQSAIAVVSSLSKHFHDDTFLHSSALIAEERNLSQALVAKILTTLAKHKIVNGVRGPSGGYRLARSPGNITLYDVVRLFEREGEKDRCPFGPGWCGNKKPCPLHDELVRLFKHNIEFLKRHDFSQWAKI